MAELIAFLDTKQMTLIDKLNDIYNTYDWILFSSLSLIKICVFQQVNLKKSKTWNVIINPFVVTHLPNVEKHWFGALITLLPLIISFSKSYSLRTKSKTCSFSGTAITAATTLTSSTITKNWQIRYLEGWEISKTENQTRYTKLKIQSSIFAPVWLLIPFL